MNSIAIKLALSAGWESTKKKIGLWLGCILSIMVISIVGSLLQSKIPMAPLQFLVGVAMQLVQFYLGFNLFGISLAVIDGRDVSYADLFRPRGRYWFYVLAALISGLAVIAGMILLIVPGIILSLMFIFFPFVLIDRPVGPVESLKISRQLTAGVKWDLFLFGLLILGLNLLGLLCLGVGFLVTTGISNFALAHVYRQRTGALAGSSAE